MSLHSSVLNPNSVVSREGRTTTALRELQVFDGIGDTTTEGRTAAMRMANAAIAVALLSGESGSPDFEALAEATEALMQKVPATDRGDYNASVGGTAVGGMTLIADMHAQAQRQRDQEIATALATGRPLTD